MTAPPPVDGTCAPGFEAVAEAFSRNFSPTEIPGRAADAGDIGAGLTVILGGETVVDLWGGWQDEARTQPWQRDTLVNAYSTIKPVAATLALLAVDAGKLALDTPLVNVWPELGAGDNTSLTLRHVLCHQAGLPAVRQTLPDEAIYDWATMTQALAATPAWWEPGTAHGYHTNTFGFLVGEPVCRVLGASFPELLRTHITGPHNLDLHVGLDPTEHARCAQVVTPTAGAVSSSMFPTEPTNDAELMLRNTYVNPPGISGMGVVNTAAWRQACVPSTNGHATARALAGFHSLMLPDAAQPLVSSELLTEATMTQAEGNDRVLQRPIRFGLGYALHQDARPIGTSPAAYGHFGYGGSLGFADPTHDLAFGYVINRPGDRWKNPRVNRLLGSVKQALGAPS